MGEGEAGGIEGGSVRGRHHNSPHPSSWYTWYAELAARALSRARSKGWNRITGLDPAPRGETGYAELIVSGSHVTSCRTLKASIEDILPRLRPGILVVDAPLHPPYHGYRASERMLLENVPGARLLPGGLPGMRLLSLLGYSILHLSVEAGIIVFETHPGSIRRIHRLPVIGGKDIYDAVLAASAGLCALLGESYYIVAGDGLIVFPGRKCKAFIIKMIRECLGGVTS